MTAAAPISFGRRVCWSCDRPIFAAATCPGDALEHCGSPGCHWCRNCHTKKMGEAK